LIQSNSTSDNYKLFSEKNVGWNFGWHRPNYKMLMLRAGAAAALQWAAIFRASIYVYAMQMLQAVTLWETVWKHFSERVANRMFYAAREFPD
jgi:hypothetical protein